MKTTFLFSLILLSALALPLLNKAGNHSQPDTGLPDYRESPKDVSGSGYASVKSQLPDSSDEQFINKKHLQLADTTIDPAAKPLDLPAKVTMSEGDNALEFSPLGALNSGVLIQPVNRATNKGISTYFYLTDTANWSFYTNALQRFLIKGSGDIVANASLLINNRTGSNTALRVNGNARFDSSVLLLSRPDSSSFISIDNNVKRAVTEVDDGISPYTSTPTGWANGKNLPVFRLRHPDVVASNQVGVNSSIQKDFMILPYQYGTAIEYNGVVECWVGEWSIHRGLAYHDVEGKNNGWGGVLWVGDDHDLGGVRATARNNSMTGGNVNYGEISVENFSGSPHGDFRLRLPSAENEFQFIYGEKGSTNIVATMSANGLTLPKVASVNDLPAPGKGQLVFDSTDSQFKGYNGSEWKDLSDNPIITGTLTISGNGNKDFVISHGQSEKPAYFNVIATSEGAANIGYVTADAQSIIVHYTVAPQSGIGNLSWNWQIKK